MQPLSVLLVVERLVRRSGLSLYVHDVARELHRRGHRPIVYSPLHGEVAAVLREATIPVPGRLDDIAAAPDLIHGHNHFETMQALLHFPSAPAVFTCHGWGSWKNEPPIFPRVRRYLPVDDTCRDRLLLEHGIPDARISIHRNFVDLSRFAPRAALPASPARVFLFSSKSDPGHAEMLAQVCAQRGIALEVLSEDGIEEPASVIGNFDLVFARGRCALESMAVGAAVVVYGFEGLGPMVTTANVDRLRPLNFGRRALRQPATRDGFDAAIASYDAADATAVSRHIRDTCGLEEAVTSLLATYAAVVDEHRQSDLDYAAEERAAADYLAATVRYFEDGVTHSIAAARTRAKKDFRARLKSELNRVNADHARHDAEVETARALERERLLQEKERRQTDLVEKSERVREQHAQKIDQLKEQQAQKIEQLQQKIERLQQKREQRQQKIEQRQAQRAGHDERWPAGAARQIERLQAHHLNEMERRDQTIARLIEKLEAAGRAMAEARDAQAGLKPLLVGRSRLEKERDELARERDVLNGRLEQARVQNDKLTEERNAARLSREEQRVRAEHSVAALRERQGELDRLRKAHRLAQKEKASLRAGVVGRLREYLKRLPIPGTPGRTPAIEPSRDPRK